MRLTEPNAGETLLTRCTCRGRSVQEFIFFIPIKAVRFRSRTYEGISDIVGANMQTVIEGCRQVEYTRAIAS